MDGRSSVRKERRHGSGAGGTEADIESHLDFIGQDGPGNQRRITIRFELEDEGRLGDSAQDRFLVHMLELTALEAQPKAVNATPGCAHGFGSAIGAGPARDDAKTGNGLTGSLICHRAGDRQRRSEHDLAFDPVRQHGDFVVSHISRGRDVEMQFLVRGTVPFDPAVGISPAVEVGLDDRRRAAGQSPGTVAEGIQPYAGLRDGSTLLFTTRKRNSFPGASVN